MKFLILFFFSILIFSCSENTSDKPGFETYLLVSQTVEIQDTIYKSDSNGNLTSEILKINSTSVPIRDNINETWFFENQSLRISTQLSNNKTQNINYQIENENNGFYLKRENEKQFCKVISKTNDELILETRGRIILKRIKN